MATWSWPTQRPECCEKDCAHELKTMLYHASVCIFCSKVMSRGRRSGLCRDCCPGIQVKSMTCSRCKTLGPIRKSGCCTKCLLTPCPVCATVRLETLECPTCETPSESKLCLFPWQITATPKEVLADRRKMGMELAKKYRDLEVSCRTAIATPPRLPKVGTQQDVKLLCRKCLRQPKTRQSSFCKDCIQKLETSTPKKRVTERVLGDK